MNPGKIPDIIISRLPIYLRALRNMQSQQNKNTSSQELGDWVGVSAAQIRKDLSQFGGFGKQGMGYEIDKLIKALSNILNINRVWDVAVIGMGDMGHAIARYQGFSDRGFRVAALFDNDPAKIGSRIGNHDVQDMAKLVDVIRNSDIRIAMLCVPAGKAQAVADMLVKAGIKAILNYAPINLAVPKDVRVQYLDPSIGLQRMTYYLG